MERTAVNPWSWSLNSDSNQAELSMAIAGTDLRRTGAVDADGKSARLPSS
jgi:hypothetical protein